MRLRDKAHYLYDGIHRRGEETLSNQIILFGCGVVGYKALTFLGSENIQCFCDNNPRLSGKEKYGKAVISFDDLKRNYSDAVVVICIENETVCYNIAVQCEENSIFDYIFYQPLAALFSEQGSLLHFIADSANRMRMRKEIYMSRIANLQKQVDYFKQHADIRHMKPAGGALRKRQLDTVQVSVELLDKLSHLEVKPFLCGGNLIGYVRHNGFIPWDDDIDFAMIRDEYETLKEYCRMHLYTYTEFYDENKRDGAKTVAAGMENYFWVDLLDFFAIYKPFSDGSRIRVDFFSMDYYSDDYSFKEIIDYAGSVQNQFISAGSRQEKRECIRVALQESGYVVRESKQIYFGIDSMEMRNKWHKGELIPRNVVFPLKKILYEGAYFWIPNDPEEFVSYEYENIWEFPDDIGLPRHLMMDYDMRQE